MSSMSFTTDSTRVLLEKAQALVFGLQDGEFGFSSSEESFHFLKDGWEIFLQDNFKEGILKVW